ncbi:MAG: cytochrome-c oxidase, cbb3-type subunit III [Hyphomicrobiaceae bacterium]|nr:cytochrome-c oxidase, cbb3-type subunit III [Hyphomicrobiaceae bacterium]
MTKKHEIDEVTGVETTGHEWDGIKELNKPLPRWWLLTFYASIVWAIGYWIVYPAWPLANGYTKGLWSYSQRATVASEVKAGVDAQAAMRAQLDKTTLGEVKKNPELLRFAMAAGAASFQTNCAPCHGRGAQGFVGYPNLNDDDWLWGGTVDEVHKTIQVGIRNGDDQARAVAMPRFGLDKLLDDKQIAAVTEQVLALSGKPHDKAALDAGSKVYKEQCASCHGDDGKGKIDQGAPNLTDGIWLYGGSREAIVESVRTGRGGVMPAWAPRLDAATVKSLAVYVHSLGGGK